MTPDAHTLQELMLEVGDGHTLYVHDWGNPQAARTIIRVHGGPGSGTGNSAKNLFDPATHHVIFFDQRGAGKSLPYGELSNNMTSDLVEDITKIADHLKLDKFILAGNSWGSCLSLAYGIKYPERVSGMVLSGIFTGSKAEVAWIEQGMFQIFFPEVWQAYLAATPTEHHKDPAAYHLERILGDDTKATKASAFAHYSMEGGIVQLDDTPHPPDYDSFDPAGTRIEAHYLANQCFMPQHHIIDNAAKLTMPVYLVQGRYDMVCPPLTAHNLHAQLPNGKLYYTQAGHINGHETRNLMRAVLAQLAC